MRVVKWLIWRLQAGPPALQPGESILESWLASQLRGRLMVGGVLWLTGQRLVFVPNRLEKKVWRGWSYPLESISSLSIGNADRAHLNTRRDRIVLICDHETEAFVVDDMVGAMDAISGVLDLNGV